MTNFDADTLRELHDVQEIAIPDRKAPQNRGGDLGGRGGRRGLREIVARCQVTLLQGPAAGGFAILAFGGRRWRCRRSRRTTDAWSRAKRAACDAPTPDAVGRL